MKQWKTTIGMLLVLIGLGIYVYFYERGEAPEGKVALRFDPKDVASIQFASDKSTGEIALRKTGEKSWELTKPVDGIGEKWACDSIVDHTKALEQKDVIKDAQDLSAFGLKDSKTYLVINLKNGKSLRLTFGNKTSDNQAVYAMRQGDSRILVVPNSIYDDITKELNDYRDKTVAKFEKDNLQKVAVSYGSGGGLTLERSGKDWNITSPTQCRADTTNVDTLLGKFTDLKADKFVDDNPKDTTKYSLHKPWIQLDVWEKGNTKPTSLYIGKKSKDDTGKVFAKTSKARPVFLLADSMLTDLKKSAEDLRRKNVVDVKKDDVKTFTLTNLFGSFGVEKVGNDWKLFKPNTAKADGSTVDSLLYAVQDLKADEFIDSPKPLSVYGLDKPQMEFAVTAKSGGAKLLIGKATSDKTAVFAKADPGTTVCKVPASILDSLKKNLNDLRDKTVVKFDRKDLDQFSILRDGKTLTVARTGKDKWEITQPEKAEADSSKLSSTLYTLETLSADSIVAELPSDQQQAAAKLAYYGLDKPRVQVDLTIKKQKPVTLLVGKRTQSGDKVFFMRKGDNTVYTKSEYLLIDLEKEVKDLKK